jgi:hypothetical protein
MAWRHSVAAVFIAGAFSAACHSKTAPGPPPPAAPSLSFTPTATTSYSRVNGVWQVTYSFCFNVKGLTPEVEGMAVRRVDYTLLDAAGQVYQSFADTTSNVGHVIAQTFGGCIKFLELDVVRPISPTVRSTIEFFDATTTYTRSVDAAVTNNVPPWPFIDTVTVAADISDGQQIVRERRPITFTVTQVTGGVPPFLYKFKMNGFVMRDWSSDPVWVWDAQTLNNAPTVSGGYSCVVEVRRSTFPLSEQIGRKEFILLLSAPESHSLPLAR